MAHENKGEMASSVFIGLKAVEIAVGMVEVCGKPHR
jgi:hypothetical protein